MLSRLKKELQIVGAHPPPGCAAWAADDKLLEVHGFVEGPEGSPYEGGRFQINMKFPETYPFSPPVVRFLTPIYHPNIDASGNICLDILSTSPKGTWTPCQNISTILLSLRSLMATPNAEDPLMPEIAMQMKENFELYKKAASDHTQKFSKRSNI
ncbi:putative ubiquitin-conjugating enzyme E2 T [Monocercomonoides exilis]|uniref:putative ubiquitin-conjugating enzyme E2 T n=1 Tax=Monocercomonoides exilis TaxID=2049356 RepID=UPI003559FCD2|nr:putative ubiquitin-conjugating enzyme E2 T [Monocercomonoides exilis]|eukprot:MONOS_3331.1-p1 / transcript=MONOS_3331.1 / gene=MONOS_3331 / organism=Monocercomonoides_exilis_PA203 / gene_product=ubiquitin-conjugating enzyme E2 T / transcript_product=ubiquitin-conjugating enzyme E2 T / location=Mono_scaffold00077:107869-108478(+) / protein_length=154 / sequence_SO=supercontig / SO=protein_coding / is_pseudo=false